MRERLTRPPLLAHERTTTTPLPITTTKTSPPIAVVVAAVAVAAGAAGVVLAVVERHLAGQPPLPELVAQSTASAGLAAIGALVAMRRRDSPLGWFMLAIGLETALTQLTYRYGLRYVLHPGQLAPKPESASSTRHLEDTLSPVFAALLFLHFPTGRLPSHRWRPMIFVIAGVAAVSLVTLFLVSGQLADLPGVVNPFGVRSISTGAGSVHDVTIPLVNFCFLIAGASLVARWRRATGIERQQIKWLATTAVVLALLLVAGQLFEPLTGAFFFGVLLVPTSIAIAVLRYRLYDIDVVISRALVFASLAAFVTLIYVIVVVGLGSLVSAGRSNPALSVAATALTAIAFQPVRDRARRVANRLVYGERTTPYEAMSRLAEHVGEAAAADEHMQLVARLLSEGTGGTARVWLRVGDHLRPAASWPEDAAATDAVDFPALDAPDFGDVDHVVAVVHHDETLGYLTLKKPVGEPVAPPDVKLMSGLAGQAGLLLRNARLTAELYERLDQLRASRQRLVAAQDEERRKLERDLHDGAQQQIVAVKIKLGVAAGLAQDEHAEVTAQAIAQLVDEVSDAVDTLRDLAHGIYPPLLAAEGLAMALRSQGRKSVVPVEVVASDLGRYGEEIEATVYFCCLEALQNVTKYAQATSVQIDLNQLDNVLHFAVTDDGCGFDPETVRRGAGLQNMEDRLDAVGGTLVLSSVPGAGSTLSGAIPLSDA
ncbi:MAG: hypothetical protein QOJ00_370 [Actinomycetota bacterium]